MQRLEATTHGETHASDPLRRAVCAPLFAWSLVVVAGIAALLGIQSRIGVMATAVLLTGAALKFTPSRSPARGAATRRSVWVALTVLTIVWTAANATQASELVLTGRDGATYATIAKGLVDTADLTPTVAHPPFGEDDRLDYESAGFVMRGGSEVYQQFLHAVPAAWALFGDFGVLRANVLFGASALVAFFGLMRRYLTDWMSLGATLCLSLTLPLIYYSRSTFTEPAALAMLLTGLWIAAAAIDSRNRNAALVAGFVLGAGALARIDAWVVAVGIAWALTIEEYIDSSAGSTKVLRRLWMGLLAVGVIGLVDLMVFSGAYLQMHRQQLVLLFAAVLAARVATSRPVRRLVERAASVFAIAQGWTVRIVYWSIALFAAFVFLFRPMLTTSFGEPYGIAGIEAASGLQVGSGRDYYELAGWWQIWYLGVPVGAAALIFVVARCLTSRRLPAVTERLILMAMGTPTALYLLDPNVNPDHIWAMRRYLVGAIPLLVGVAWIGLSAFTRRFTSSGVRRSASITGAIALLLSPLGTTLPLVAVTEGDGGVRAMGILCEGIDERPVLIVEGEEQLGQFLLHPIRVWCDVPVASVDAGAAAAVLSSIDRRVVLVAADSTLLARPSILVEAEVRFIEETLISPPTDTGTIAIRLFGSDELAG